MLGAIGSVLGGLINPVGAVIGKAIGSTLESNSAQRQANSFEADEAGLQRDFASAQQVKAEQFNAEQAGLARDFSSLEAQKTRDFQERMSGSAYQRAMDDMRLAGLNPMLAYSQGGSSLPVGATASTVSASVSPASGVSARYPTGAGPMAISSAAASKQADTAADIGVATVSKIKQEVVNLSTDNDRVKSVIDNLRVEYQNLVKQGYNLTEVGNQLRATVSKLNAEVPFIRSQTFTNSMNGRLFELDVQAAEKLDNFGRELQQLKPFFDILRSIFRPR